jgi:hypothetical protein
MSLQEERAAKIFSEIETIGNDPAKLFEMLRNPSVIARFRRALVTRDKYQLEFFACLSKEDTTYLAREIKEHPEVKIDTNFNGRGEDVVIIGGVIYLFYGPQSFFGPITDKIPGKTNGMMKAVLKDLSEGQRNIRQARDKQRGHSRRDAGFNDRWDNMTRVEQQSFRANKRSVWTCSPAQYKEEHFAVFPEALIWDMVLAGCPVGGVVLDPFFGRGTTGVVAAKQDKKYIGIELLHKNVLLARKYLYQELGFMTQE